MQAAFEFPIEVVAMVSPLLDRLGLRSSWLLLLSAAITVAVMGTIRGVALIWWGRHAHLHMKIRSLASSDREDRPSDAAVHGKGNACLRSMAEESKEKQAAVVGANDQEGAGFDDSSSWMDEEREKDCRRKHLQILPPLSAASDQGCLEEEEEEVEEEFEEEQEKTDAIAESFKPVVRHWQPTEFPSFQIFHPLIRSLPSPYTGWEEDSLKLLLGTSMEGCLSLWDPLQGNSITSSAFQRKPLQASSLSAKACLICGLAMDQSIPSLGLPHGPYDLRALPQACGYVINNKLDLHGVQLHGHECHVYTSSTSSFLEFDLRMIGAKPINALMLQNPKRKLGSGINPLQGTIEEMSRSPRIFV